MRAWRKIFAALAALTVLIFAGANLLLYYLKAPESGRPYRVEINRTALLIGQEGLASVDLAECEYVRGITKLDEGFFELTEFNTDSDYTVRDSCGNVGCGFRIIVLYPRKNPSAV